MVRFINTKPQYLYLYSMDIKIPKGWHEITIATYQTILDIEAAGLEPLDKQIQIIAVLGGISQDKAEDLTISQIRTIMANIKWLNDKPTKFINKFKLNGKTYSVECNLNKMTAAQYIDFSEYCKEGANENLHKIMTVFCRPTKRRLLSRKAVGYGEGYDISALAEEFRTQLTMEIVFPLSAFFLKLWEGLQPVILNYLNEQREKLTQEVLEEIRSAMQSNGVGLSSSTT